MDVVVVEQRIGDGGIDAASHRERGSADAALEPARQAVAGAIQPPVHAEPCARQRQPIEIPKDAPGIDAAVHDIGFAVPQSAAQAEQGDIFDGVRRQSDSPRRQQYQRERQRREDACERVDNLAQRL